MALQETMSLISGAATLTANLPTDCRTQRSAFHNDSKDSASLQIYSADFPCRVTQVFQRQKGRTLSLNPGNCKFHLGSKDRIMFAQNPTSSM